MKIIKIVLCLFAIAAVSYLLDSFLSGSGVMIGMAVTGGPLRDFKWGGITFRPTKDGEAEFETSGNNYEKEPSPNGDSYSTAEARIGYVQQECAMTATEYSEFKKLQDGEDRSGTATLPNGDILSVNCSIDGEHLITSGKVTIKLAGDVRLQ